MSGRGDKTKQAFADNRPTQKKPANRKLYNLLVDDVPYLVSTEAFTYNGEQRYYVSVNDGSDHVFTWDSDLKRLTAINDESGTLPEALEEEISIKLQADL